MIVHKPHKITICLDPDTVAPADMVMESRTLVIEEGKLLMGRPPQLETFDPSTNEAKKILGDATAAVINSLNVYQNEVWRLAAQLFDLHNANQEKITSLEEQVRDLEGKPQTQPIG